MSSSREKILEKIKSALADKKTAGEVDRDFSGSIYHEVELPLHDAFKKQLESIKGEAHLCENENAVKEKIEELIDSNKWQHVACVDPQLQAVLPEAVTNNPGIDNDIVDTSITRCEYLVAHTGSAIVSSNTPSGRRLNVFPPVHLIVANASQLTTYLDEAIEKIEKQYPDEKPSQISIITGPSRTADIEKTLVMGAHGPKSLIVLINLSK
ncbi:hypothetical protein EYV94_22350 [Puteibacter caeruleilacunae]|nr:hypothetical protein EYV94_22350 [Puteibacter caeruleilacunae]